MGCVVYTEWGRKRTHFKPHAKHFGMELSIWTPLILTNIANSDEAAKFHLVQSFCIVTVFPQSREIYWLVTLNKTSP